MLNNISAHKHTVYKTELYYYQLMHIILKTHRVIKTF